VPRGPRVGSTAARGGRLASLPDWNDLVYCDRWCEAVVRLHSPEGHELRCGEGYRGSLTHTALRTAPRSGGGRREGESARVRVRLSARHRAAPRWQDCEGAPLDSRPARSSADIAAGDGGEGERAEKWRDALQVSRSRRVRERYVRIKVIDADLARVAGARTRVTFSNSPSPPTHGASAPGLHR